ncbi:MAG: HAMP domain-containing sensor histidine kinase [Coriobacteriia bacterium]|nr:HAMP domain-containing sensor histidine kinase [Coriobacteriia bacterium]
MLTKLLARLRVRHDVPAADLAGERQAPAPEPHDETGAQVPEEIEALLEQVKLAYEQQSRLIRGIGHDFKSPLASILRSSEALAAGEFGPMEPDQAETCRLIAESARNLTAIAQALYAVGDAGENAAAFEHAAIDVREALIRTVDAHRSAASAKGLDLTLEFADEGPLPVCAAQGAIERVLGNVLHNAVKFTFDGSIRVTCARDDESVEIAVEDTGIGIPEDEIETIGTEFVRGSNADDVSGSGVGLAVTQYLLQRAGGSLSLTSTAGTGSRFVIRLPLAADECEKRL